MHCHLVAISVLVIFVSCACYIFIYLYALSNVLLLERASTAFFITSERLRYRKTELKSTYAPPPVNYDEGELLKTFEDRRKKVEQVCKNHLYFRPVPDKVRQKRALYALGRNGIIQTTMLVDQVNHFMFCVIGKVASTNVKKLLLYNAYNATYISPQNISDDDAIDLYHWPRHLSLKPLIRTPDSKKLLPTILHNYTKIILVRHPLVRLVSAWNSKLTGRNHYYSTVYGKHILTKYRPNLPSDFNSSVIYGNESVTLGEFFTYLQKEIKAYRMADVHWSTFNSQCMPCFIDYQYIAKLENWYPELHYILSKVTNQTSPESGKMNTEGVQQALRKRPPSSDALWKKMLNQLPKALVHAVKKVFWVDFELFGYDQQEFG